MLRLACDCLRASSPGNTPSDCGKRTSGPDDGGRHCPIARRPTHPRQARGGHPGPGIPIIRDTIKLTKPKQTIVSNAKRSRNVGSRFAPTSSWQSIVVSGLRRCARNDCDSGLAPGPGSQRQATSEVSGDSPHERHCEQSEAIQGCVGRNGVCVSGGGPGPRRRRRGSRTSGWRRPVRCCRWGRKAARPRPRRRRPGPGPAGRGS